MSELQGSKSTPRRGTIQKEKQMYIFDTTKFDMDEVRERYDAIRAPLTMFAPYPHEETEAMDLLLMSEANKLQLDRPVTPVNEEIKSEVGTFAELTKLVARRIVVKKDKQLLDPEEQEELGNIIIGELRNKWSDYHTQVDDAFLTSSENKELKRRLTVHVVTVCEKLFNHYLQKAYVLRKRGVFSDVANISRLKAQLAVDTNRFLNITSIQRHLLREIQGKTISDAQLDSPQTKPPLSHRNMLRISRPKPKKEFVDCEPDDLKEIVESMPQLDSSKLCSLLSDLPRPKSAAVSSQDDTVSKDKTTPLSGTYSDDEELTRLHLPRSESVPLLREGETLLEELGITVDRRSVMSLDEIADQLASYRSQGDKESEVDEPQPGTREYAALDLHRMTVANRDEAGDMDDDDIPPLIQAMTRSSKHDNKRELINKQLQELEERERARQAQEEFVIQKATHPQPATISTTLPNKMVVKTSDARVSDRVCLSSITLKKYATVYNDIIDEIEPAMVTQLDSNLYLSDEISEVYTEIMKTIPTDHLDLENDVLVEASADAVDLTSTLASASLSKRPKERIINKSLVRKKPAPWGEKDSREWVRTPGTPTRDKKGRPVVMPSTPRVRGEANKDIYGEGYEHDVSPSPATEPDVTAKSYASWLNWWKSTMNADDYMKYISTQESDFLGVVFHFYNSDDEDEEDEASQMSRRTKLKLQQEKEEKIKELRKAKSEYTEGLWNINSVLLGGLGRQFSVEDDDDELSDTASFRITAPQSASQGDSQPRPHTDSQASHHSGSQGTPRQEAPASSRSRRRYKTRETTLIDQSQTETKTPTVKSSNRPSTQERLEKVWAALQMPDHLRLDMAIKYSTNEYHHQLIECIEALERTTTLILQRENLLAKLEKFERHASDPNRFFERGTRGSSLRRLRESKIRTSLYKKISSVDEELKAALAKMKNDYNEIVTFQGRTYEDKMHWDRTEMLYWLQEERKQQAMEYEAKAQNLTPLPMKMTQLEPIPGQ